MNIKRNVLLNPGPATTTDTVKLAQVVTDICPREKEFGKVMEDLSKDLLKIVHAKEDDYATVLFCGSGTINIDICLNSLLDAGKKTLIVNNGAYSSRAVEVCKYYGLPFVELKYKENEIPNLDEVNSTLANDSSISLVYTTHNETGTGLLNPIREIGKIAHDHKAMFVVDTTSTLAMRPIDVYKDNIDFCMASAQKGIMAMSGLSFVIGNKSIIEESQNYPKRSYYCNLFLQYDYFRKNYQMHFTPPVQVIYAASQALKEYFAEGEENKWNRHLSVNNTIREELDKLGFKTYIPREQESGLVVSVLYPNDPNWDFDKVHDYCYERGFTIYPGKIAGKPTFRLCSLGAIYPQDIKDFFKVFKEALDKLNISCPIKY